MTFSAQQIADFLTGEVIGNKDITVSTFSKIEEGRPGTLTFLSNPKYTPYIYTTNADIVLVDKTFVPEQPISATLIKVDNAYQALARLLALVESQKQKKTGVHPQTVIAPTAMLGEDVYIGAFAVIGEHVKLGDRVKIYPHVTIDDYSEIGDDTILYSQVAIYEKSSIGKRCIIHSGAIIGADGFGFAPDEAGKYQKIPQIGNVVIEDDVEIGANSTIDRATLGSTVIQQGVKIDNLVQIAHNVTVGTDTAIAAQSGIAGSSKIGKKCVLAGQVGISGHINIADGSIFGAQTGVPSHIKEPGKVWQGYPAMPVGTFRRVAVITKQLPDLHQKIGEMERQFKIIEQKNK